MRTRRALLAAAAALIVLPQMATSSEPVAPIDDDFLEFLGAADSDDPEWNEYIESAAIDEVLEKPKGKAEAESMPQTTPPSKVKSQGDEP